MVQEMDTRASGTSQDTPPQQPSHEGNQNSADVSSASQNGAQQKSDVDWESRYKNLETKVGRKEFSERLGDKVIEATGYSVADLEAAGYTPEDIVSAVIQSKASGQQTQMARMEPQTDTLSMVKRTVEDSKADKAIWRADLSDFFFENPEAKDFRDEINEFHQMPQYRHLTPEELYNIKLKKFVKKGVESVEKKYSEKEKAGLSIQQTASHEPDPAKDSLERIKRGVAREEDRTKFISARLAQWRQSLKK